MTKLILADLANLQNENTAVSTLNANSAGIESAFDRALFRDGTEPNNMEASLDMDSNRIINLPMATTDLEPVRKREFDTLVAAAGTVNYNVTYTNPGVSVTAHGAVGNGSTDDTGAFVAALAALPATGGLLYVPAGKYKLTSKLTIALSSTKKSVSVRGDGQDATILYWPSAGGGIEVDYTHASCSFHMKDLSITCGAANAGTGLLLTHVVPLGTFANSDITDVTFRGDDNVAIFYWTIGCSVVGVSGIEFDSVDFLGNAAGTGGTGLSLSGNLTASPYYSIQINISKCTFNWVGTGLNHGQKVQGITVSQCNFTNGTTGITTTSSTSGAAQFVISDSQFNTQGNQIFFQTQMSDVSITNNLIYVPAAASGIDVSTSEAVSITGNNVQATVATSTNNGIVASGSKINIANNLVQFFVTGIWLKSTFNFATVLGNSCLLNTTGLRVDGSEAMITGNIFDTNTTGIIYGAASANSNQQSNKYSNNGTNITDGGTNTKGGGSL